MRASSHAERPGTGRIVRGQRFERISYIVGMIPAFVAIVLAQSASQPASQPPDRPQPATLEVWSEPIADYIARGEKLHPDGFNRAITTLMPFEGRLWIGYGDATKNLGTPAPVEFRYFERSGGAVTSAKSARVRAEGEGAPQRSPEDTGEEQIEPFRVCDGRLWQAGVDSNDPDELWTQAKPAPVKPIEGNVFVLEAGDPPVWRKHRAIPGGEHVHDICAHRGALFAVGSGSADRAEWESGRIFRTIWRSGDGGATWTVAHREMYPDLGKGDTRFRRLLSLGDRLYAFGYVNPFVDKGPLEGRHVEWRDGAFVPLEAPGAEELARLVVSRTWDLGDGSGLVIARGAEPASPTRAFIARGGRFVELAAWRGVRVVDLASTRDGWFVLCGVPGASERFELRRFEPAAPDRLVTALDLGAVGATAFAEFDGSYLVGTDSGRILRVAAIAP